MAKKQKWVIFSLALISLLAFLIFAIPNSKASENMAMVTMFEPDESAMVPIVQRMVGPHPDLIHTVYRFIAYSFYSYGFPHFAPSALVYMVLRWFGQASNLSLVMLSLRQVISVLPMIASLWILVYLQDQFKTWRSPALFIFLLSVPAVVQNGYWWHPDGLVMLFSSLVLYFLWKDDRKFGRHFYIAAVLCGVLVALKVVGFFFFLTIGIVLIWGLIEKRLTTKQFLVKALQFILIMAVSIVVASPHLLIPNHREFAFTVLKREIFETSKGYGIFYEKGLQSAWQTMHAYYGEAVFLLMALGVSVWSLWDKKSRFLSLLILGWFIPLSTHLLFFSHFKYQYWLPVAIPVFSNLAFLLPKDKHDWAKKDKTIILKAVFLVIVVVQFGLFLARDVELFQARNDRAKNNPAIQFYDKAVAELAPVTQEVLVYYDYRLYMPEKPGWHIENSFDLLTYDYIKSRNFDLLFLSQQRILDYIHPSAVGIDPSTFAQSQQFYRDANEENLEGYRLLLRDDSVLLYIRQDVCDQYFSPEKCD